MTPFVWRLWRALTMFFSSHFWDLKRKGRKVVLPWEEPLGSCLCVTKITRGRMSLDGILHPEVLFFLKVGNVKVRKYLNISFFFNFFALKCHLLSLLSMTHFVFLRWTDPPVQWQNNSFNYLLPHETPTSSLTPPTFFDWAVTSMSWQVSLYWVPAICVAVCCGRHCCLCHHRSHSLLAKLILDQQWQGNKLKPFPLRRSNTNWSSWRGKEWWEGQFLLRSPVLQQECTLSFWSEQQLTRSQIKLRMHKKNMKSTKNCKFMPRKFEAMWLGKKQKHTILYTTN